MLNQKMSMILIFEFLCRYPEDLKNIVQQQCTKKEVDQQKHVLIFYNTSPRVGPKKISR